MPVEMRMDQAHRWSVLSQFAYAFSNLSGNWPYKSYDKAELILLIFVIL